MPNPGAFRGSRKDFLQAQLAAYKTAVEANHAADTLSDIQRRYFKRYPIDLPHDEEPTAEHLDKVDDNEPDQEIDAPNADSMREEEYVKVIDVFTKCQALILFRKAQIKRWMAYQYFKSRDLPPKESGAIDPYSILLYKLTGVGINKPRKRVAYNVWGKTQAEMIEKKVRERATAQDLKSKNLANIRCQITRELFQALPPEEKQAWEMQAVEEHKRVTEDWTKATTSAISTDSEDRQLCIERLPQFVRPILDMICECTGWKASLIVGGPEPADGGRLNILGIHSGTVQGPVPMSFGHSECEVYKKYLLPMYSRFLKKCYTVQECRGRALPNESMNLSAFNTEGDGWSLDHVDETASNHHNPKPPNTNNGDKQRDLGSLDHVDETASNINHYSPKPPNTNNGSEQNDLGLPNPQSLALPALPCAVSHSHSPTPAITPPISRAPSPGVPPSRPLTPTAASPILRVPSPSPSMPTAAPSISSAPSPLPPTAASSIVPQSTAPVVSGAISSSTLSASTPCVSSQASSLEQALGNHHPLSASTSPCQRPHAKRPRAISDDNDDHVKGLHKRGRHDKGHTRSRTSIQDDSEMSRATPQWLSRCFSMLNCDDLGDTWKILVRKWFDLEKASVDTHNEKPLSSISRPPAIGDWIKRARSHTWYPQNLDLKQYEMQFWKWWIFLQPDWRKHGDELLDVDPGLDWMPLRVFGKNGLVSVLAGLYFWSRNIGATSDDWAAWRLAVTDVANVINVL